MSKNDGCKFEHRGSKFPLHDGYGIFLTYACEFCEDERLSHFRSDIMERYDTDETIEPEDSCCGERWEEDGTPNYSRD